MQTSRAKEDGQKPEALKAEMLKSGKVSSQQSVACFFPAIRVKKSPEFAALVFPGKTCQTGDALMTLLQQLIRERAERREALRLEVRRHLRRVLCQLAPADQVVVFGSLAKPFHFHETSDIDLAMAAEPAGMSLYQLTALLAEEMGRQVDIVLLPECRFRERIATEGETWTLAA